MSLSRRRPQRFLLCVLAFQIASCASYLDPRVESSREALIGVSAKRLSKCLGPPTDVDVDPDGETERLTFRVYEKQVDRTVRDPSRRVELPEPRPMVTTAYCELKFEVNDGRVRHVDVKGRNTDGLSSPACIFEHEICLSRSSVD